MKSLGEHFIYDCYDCNTALLNDPVSIKNILFKAALEGSATVISDTIHQFSPYGVSGVLVIAESHIAIHTWPEHGFAALEFFRCSETFDVFKSKEIICSDLKALRIEEKSIVRGELLPHF